MAASQVLQHQLLNLPLYDALFNKRRNLQQLLRFVIKLWHFIIKS